MGTFGALLGIGHALVNAPSGRWGMVAAGSVLVVAGIAVTASAAVLASSPLRALVTHAYVLVAIAATMAMIAFEGTVAGPAGILAVGPLTLIAVTGSRRAVVGVTAAILAVYAAIAILGDAGPTGYVLVHVTSLLTLVVACAMRRQAMLRDQSELRRLARTDPLTGSLNRRGFQDRLDRELADGPRPLLLVSLDLDAFKAVNDSLGHEGGDAVLRFAASAVRGTLGPDAALGRVGGDELAVLLPGRGLQDAAAVEAAIVAALAPHASASAGSASAPADGDSAEMLHAAADARLYAAKRNRPEREEVLRRASTLRAGRRAGDESPVARRGSRRGALRTILGTHLVGFTLASVYGVTTLEADGHAAIAALGLTGVAAAAVLLATRGLRRLPRAARRAVMLAYTAYAFALVVAFSVLDGGPGGPVAASFILPAMAIATTTSPRTVAAVCSVLVASYGGVVALTHTGPPGYLPLLVLVTVAVAAACCAQQSELVRQRRLLAELSRTDPLTGCLNRRGFLDALHAEAGRTGVPLSLLTVDLDEFKRVNDRQGHAAGDELLQWVANALQGCLRQDDLVGRIGGDEFCVLLPGASPAVGASVAARLEAVLRERAPASVGHASFPAEADGVEALQRLADERMYEHKRQRTTGGDVLKSHDDGAPVPLEAPR
jgi:diguanylate cyclase (GGDEF)-like protein